MFTRREFFLSTASVAAALGPMRAFAQDAKGGESALITGKIKMPKYEEIPGLLSKDQVTPHVQAHYGGALKAYLEVEDIFAKVYKGEAKVSSREFRELQQDRVVRANSVVLHELYFDNIAAKMPDPPEDVRKAIAERFGSLERWVEDFKDSAKAANGWAMLVHHPVSRKLYNIVLDAHDVGPMVLGVPLVLIDMYEHAFYVDYKNKKGDYINNFVKYFDWNEINLRYQAARK
jgi:Fe-Mn family superoxide dismutase